MSNWQSFAYGSSPLPHYQLEDIQLDKLGNLWINSTSMGSIIYNPNGVQGWECIDKTLQIGSTTGIETSVVNATNNHSVSPNPFSSTTTLEFNLSETKNVSISITDVMGRIVKPIQTKYLQQGNNKIEINLSELNHGIYFCKINSTENSLTIKLIKR